MERHRLLWLYVENETDLTDGDNCLLYFAPTERIAEKLRESGNEVVTADLAMEGVDIRLDITRLPFAEQSFDGIICSHVLEHIPDDRTAISEMRDALVPGGDALIMVPKDKNRAETYEDESLSSPEAREQEFGTEGHVRLYGTDFSRRLSESGFDVSVETYARELGETATERYGLRVDGGFVEREYEDIHHCRSPPDSEQNPSKIPEPTSPD